MIKTMAKKHYSKKVREILPLFKENGFEIVSTKGSHIKFKDAVGNTIVVNKDLNVMVRKRIEKEILSAGKDGIVKLNVK